MRPMKNGGAVRDYARATWVQFATCCGGACIEAAGLRSCDSCRYQSKLERPAGPSRLSLCGWISRNPVGRRWPWRASISNCTKRPSASETPRNTSQRPRPRILTPTMARINLPPITRGLLAATLFFTLLNFALRPNSTLVEKVEKPLVGVGNGVPYLTIVPGKSVIYPWVFALATVVEQNLAGLVINGATLFYGGRYLERAWGEREFAKFILFVAMVPNILSFLLYLAGYVITSKTVPLYVHGFSCIKLY